MVSRAMEGRGWGEVQQVQHRWSGQCQLQSRKGLRGQLSYSRWQVHASAKPAIPPAMRWVDGATFGLLFGFFADDIVLVLV